MRKWDDMEILLDYSFKQLGVDNLANRSVFMTEAIMNPIANKTGMLELMFEKFGV